ncbi:MAG TPA: hypothetical protein VFV24_00440 [Candidatus Eisenbacteria bacterium]|nr:hypothetical protein [Candidatus Eisenbacteria bacterium]
MKPNVPGPDVALMAAERWKRRLTLVYIFAWALWALMGLSAIVNYSYSRDGYRYPRVVVGTVLACAVMPAFVLGVLRRAFDRFVNAPPPQGRHEETS